MNHDAAELHALLLRCRPLLVRLGDFIGNDPERNMLCYKIALLGDAPAADGEAPENSVCTPAYRDHMKKVDALSKVQLARIVKWVIDDLYGVGEGDPHSPRALNPNNEWDDTTAFEVSQSLDANDLIPPEYCACGKPIEGGDGFDGLCGTCADREESNS